MTIEDTLTHITEEEKAGPQGHVVFLTGGAGYVGAMIAYLWSSRADVAKVIVLDKETIPELFRGNPKIHYIQGNTVDNFWEEEVRNMEPTIVVHAAWQIRAFYGKKGKYKEWRWNIVGSQHIFEFAFEMPSVQKVIHFSTVASYGAFSSNTFEKIFTENDPFRKSQYAYAEEKRVAEDVLKEELSYAKADGRRVSVYVLRPASITGPRRKKLNSGMGLQSVLSGTMKTHSLLEKLVALLVTFMPATKKWARQYIHEDDIVDILTLLALDSGETDSYETFNLCPPGKFVDAKDMAASVGKKVVMMPPFLVRFVFSLFWHASFGKIPTSPGSWRAYCYPILVDGSKLERLYGYKYQYQSLEALESTSSKYETLIASLKAMPRK